MKKYLIVVLLTIVLAFACALQQRGKMVRLVLEPGGPPPPEVLVSNTLYVMQYGNVDTQIEVRPPVTYVSNAVIARPTTYAWNITMDRYTNLWVGSVAESKVIRFEYTNSWARTVFAAKVNGFYPNCICSDTNGDIWTGQVNWISRYVRTNAYTRVDYGTLNGAAPVGICCDPSNNIWYADANRGEWGRYNAQSNYLYSVYNHGAGGSSAGRSMIADRNGNVYCGNGAGKFLRRIARTNNFAFTTYQTAGNGSWTVTLTTNDNPVVASYGDGYTIGGWIAIFDVTNGYARTDKKLSGAYSQIYPVTADNVGNIFTANVVSNHVLRRDAAGTWSVVGPCGRAFSMVCHYEGF